jgi:Tol biopolymer transport system component
MRGTGATRSGAAAGGQATARPGLPLLLAGVVVACLVPTAASGHAADPLDARGQTSALAIKATANTGADLKATATFSPHRSGRPVVFQVKTGSGWRREATGHESATGVAVFTVPTTTPGKFSYRAVALAFHGLALVETPTRLVTIIDTGKTTRVNLTPTGAQSAGSQNDDPIPSISATGRYIAFDSWATDLTPNANGESNIFVRDEQTGTTTLVSATSDGTAGDDHSGQPAISANGRWVAYTSLAANIVPEPLEPRGGEFLYDSQTGKTIRVDEASNGTLPNDTTTQWVAINADGRYVAYWSEATNLTPAGQPGVFLFDRVTHTTTQIAVETAAMGADDRPSISADGRYVVFATPDSLVHADTNISQDVYLWDRTTGALRWVSAPSASHPASDGASSFPTISANGRYVVYSTNTSRLLMWDRKTHKTRTISTGGLANAAAVNADGSAVAFVSGTGDQIYVWDRATRRATPVSVSPKGALGNQISQWPTISADGRFVAFMSGATNLVHGDTNIHYDVFLRDRFPR